MKKKLFNVLFVSLVSVGMQASLAPKAATQQDVVRDAWSIVQPRIVYTGRVLRSGVIIAYLIAKNLTSKCVQPSPLLEEIQEWPVAQNQASKTVHNEK